MSTQAKRRTSSQKRRRAINLTLSETTLNSCASCGNATKPHRACSKCGEYTKSKNATGATASTKATSKPAAKKTTTSKK